MPEREPPVERRAASSRPGPAAAPPSAARPAALALQRQVGNRAFGRALARMETTEAVEALEQSLGAGVMGAQRQVVDTLTAFSADPNGFDTVAKDYEKKVEAPLPPAISGVPGATELVPDGWFPGISG